MNEKIQLIEYSNEEEVLLHLIKQFWIAHNDYTQTVEESLEDLRAWTGFNHKVFLIEKSGVYIGFVHLGSRGGELDWIEDLFVLPEYQGNGYGSIAIRLTEDIVKKYSESIYLEVAARNLNALKLYHRQGYNCLNTITIRKDFEPENFNTIRNENLLCYPFEVRKK